ncbi:MAG: DUF2911 domain-containing protein [Kofleriaceae bacterium]
MKALLISAMFVPALAVAQPALELPALSPHAKVEQRVGVTDLSVDYSSPAVKGRKIWGELVPYDKVWRAGANQATKLTASRDFKLGTTAVKAGTYSVFMIPGKTSWSVMLNSDLTASQDSHDPKKDVAKVTVTPAPQSELRERMVFVFSNTADDKTALDLEWEKVRIRIPIAVDTRGHSNAAIEAATKEAWRPHFASANYLNEVGETDRALTLVAKSIVIQPTWRNEWLNAQLLMKKGKKAEAKAAAARAQKLGAGDTGYEQFFKATITKTVAGWK